MFQKQWIGIGIENIGTMLNELEMWTICRDVFASGADNAVQYSIRLAFKNRLTSNLVNGICGLLNEYYKNNALDTDTYRRMKEKIHYETVRINLVGGYIAPLTLEGAKVRVEFCNRMIASLSCEEV